jgi:hypothetical protein
MQHSKSTGARDAAMLDDQAHAMRIEVLQYRECDSIPLDDAHATRRARSDRV